MISKSTDIWGESHTGYKRSQNEDRFLIKELSDLLILAVADGMGGLPGGEIAAQIVIDTLQDYKFSEKSIEKDLKIALGKSEKQIHQKVNKNTELDGMGTTITAATLYKNKVFWIHVGDSRMYLLHNNKIKQVTTDHTFIQDLLDDGTLTPDQVGTHPLRNVLDQCVGCDGMEPDTGVFNIEQSDRLLLCSDGLTMHLSDVQIESILKTKSLQKAGQQLIQMALKMGGADNVSVIVMEFY
jgi:protein phosphatase